MSLKSRGHGRLGGGEVARLGAVLLQVVERNRFTRANRAVRNLSIRRTVWLTGVER